MSLERAPLAAFAPRSEAAAIYAALWAEIAPRLDPRATAHGTAAGAVTQQGSQSITLRNTDYVLSE
jgi:hypothetical protein